MKEYSSALEKRGLHKNRQLVAVKVDDYKNKTTEE